MPELPEVEYTARQLRTEIVGAAITKAHIFWERTIGHPALPDFLLEISGRRIEGVRRRGKFLLLDLSGELFLAIHRRMTGNLLLLPPGWRIDTSLQTGDPLAWSIRGPTFLPEIPTDNSYSRGLLQYCRNLWVPNFLWHTSQRRWRSGEPASSKRCWIRRWSRAWGTYTRTRPSSTRTTILCAAAHRSRRTRSVRSMRALSPY